MSRKEREEKKMPFIMATYLSACSTIAAHGFRSDQNLKYALQLGPEIRMYVILVIKQIEGPSCLS